MEPQSVSVTDKWQELERQLLMQTTRRLPVTLVRGKGVKVWDAEGKEYLDFVAGWAVNSLGHCHPVVVAALTKQAKCLIQTSNQFYTIPQIELAKLLIDNSCFDRVFFCNSGAEANEGAIKLARRYGKLRLNGAYEIITARGSFHGRTLATVAATGQEKFQQPYIPLPEGFVNVDYNSVDAVKMATTSKTCAVMVEPIQGESGVNVPSNEYLKELRVWCDERGILLIFDEVQTGIARTGSLFAYEQAGVEPDVMTLAKGLGGGVPIGALLAKEKASVFSVGEHGSTFGGNPLVCAVSLAVLRFIIENDIPGHVRKVGNHLRACLEKLKAKFDFITEVRGKGLLLAVEFAGDIAEKVVLACLEEGLMVNMVKPNAIRFMPPLIITEKDADEAVKILDKVLSRR
jgi:predicted acetylornithine/succinylornithine family transaminase